jgi:hypothetical protein
MRGGRRLRAMTDTARSPRYRRRAQTLRSQRQLAREAAEAGEPLASIGARLKIPPSTLSDWARADGFRACDLKAKAAAAAAAETEANRVRREAEAALLALGDDGTLTELEREVDLGRARVGALLEARLLTEAEADMRKARRLLSLIRFAAPVQGRERVWTDADYADPPEYAGWDGHTRMAWMAGDYTFARFEPIQAYVREMEDSGQGEAFHALRRTLDAEYRPQGQRPFNSPYGVADFDRKVWWMSCTGGLPEEDKRRTDAPEGEADEGALAAQGGYTPDFPVEGWAGRRMRGEV